jgi:hypothetical protein
MQILAYLDPGSGSVLLQAIVGGVAALGVTTKFYGRRLLRRLGLRRKRPAEVSGDPQRSVSSE